MESLRDQTPESGKFGVERPRLTLVPRPTTYAYRVKPLIDRALGVLLFGMVSPILLTVMLLARLFIGTPVIYRQTRIGLGGKPFELYKLRTMIPDRRRAEISSYDGPERRQSHKSPEDPRVLPLGSVLRALRLDELPQLLNVVRGDMSLVGPRPELPDIVAGYEDWQHDRHTVKPGLTGLWQVSAPEGKLMHECTDLDLQYIEQMSFATDLGILVRTPTAMIRRHGF